MANKLPKPAALIIGAGTGLSESFARAMSRDGYELHLAARNIAKLEALASETGAELHQLDGTDALGVAALVDGLQGDLRVACYNPSALQRGSIADLDPETVRKSVEITAFGSFLLGQAAARRMLAQQMRKGCRGTILFTGASAGVKGFANSAAFAMGKFAQRGLAQSMARELHPKGIHVAWINVDGAIRTAEREEKAAAEGKTGSMLDPDAIAREYMHLINQDRTAWSDELVLRPWVETF
ncbi:SDR family NAD(P)-dependent oxidoreductase [Leisingera sp. M658]|uniref:SDR family NAD(P)-dependent oxidoreductase n=1 Tax=Leisingera sp. M658 TaxID=2867015 RepID=UPI0021A581F8|nr:SDR family NAD(P)-dependent oxidoreductase [Leisingera sp. M658]UWQ76025.1 SDR family NAD(P)-dependent oxidoreductase [Leisingera sp. M658]